MLTTYSIAELLDLRPPAWLIDGVIPVQGLTAIYGRPGGGKSFIALDMALSVAAGAPWQGHPTQKGCVVYISAEGGGGLGKRVGAWLAHHQIKPYQYPDLFANFIVAAIQVHPESEDLAGIIEQTVNHPTYRHKLVEDSLECNQDPNQADDPPLFIIVDTLARCLQGDENQQEDMGNFIKGLDILRIEHDATALVVHHTNKEGFDERGSSSFRGACDTMMFASKEEGEVTLKCTKQKDYEEFTEEIFELVLIPEWESCVVQATYQRLNHERELIAEFLSEKPDTPIRDIAEALGMSKSSVHRRVLEIRKGEKGSLGQDLN